MSPSHRHSSLTVTSRRNPSSTMRIFCSDVCLCLVAAFTLRAKDLASSVRSSAASALPVFLSGSSLLLSLKYSTSSRELTPPQSSPFFYPLFCPIIADGLQRRSDVPVPPGPPTHLIVIQPHLTLGFLKGIFHHSPGTRYTYQFFQRHIPGTKAPIVYQVLRVGDAAAYPQPIPLVRLRQGSYRYPGLQS